MIRRPPRSTLFPYTDALPISGRRTERQVGWAAQRRLVEPGAGQHRRDPEQVGVLAVVAGTHQGEVRRVRRADRKSTRLNSSHANISYAVFCLKKKKQQTVTRR